jgi:hypothetical protein
MRAESKFLALFRWAKSHLRKPPEVKAAKTTIAELVDRRGTPRIYVHIPLFVYGRTSAGDPFHEETSTISINGGGGLISMSSRVQPGQRLVVTNEGNDRTEQCIVVSVRAHTATGSRIALRFPEPMPHFWRQMEIGNNP